MAVALYHAVVGIHQIERHATELRTLATVGRAVETILRGIAQTAEADAQGTVDKDLKLNVGHGFVDSADLADREFARQYYAPEPQTA